MNRLKKFWHDHKEKAKGVVLGVGATSVVTYYLIVKTKRGRELTMFEVLKSEDPTATTPSLLYVRHKDGEEGYYPILDQVPE